MLGDKMKKLLLSTVLMAAMFVPGLSSAGGYKDKKHNDSYSKVEKQDIVAIAAGNPDFSTLVTALKAADLVGALQGDGPFTVFAPTNAAFEKLPEGTVESLLKPENKAQLQNILKYHVIGASVPAKAAAGKQVELDTLAGVKADVDGTNGVVIEGATVTKADIKASNGIIHVIDKVIIPQ